MATKIEEALEDLKADAKKFAKKHPGEEVTITITGMIRQTEDIEPDGVDP